jgi:hypothetical protein
MCPRCSDVVLDDPVEFEKKCVTCGWHPRVVPGDVKREVEAHKGKPNIGHNEKGLLGASRLSAVERGPNGSRKISGRMAHTLLNERARMENELTGRSPFMFITPIFSPDRAVLKHDGGFIYLANIHRIGRQAVNIRNATY